LPSENDQKHVTNSNLRSGPENTAFSSLNSQLRKGARLARRKAASRPRRSTRSFTPSTAD